MDSRIQEMKRDHERILEVLKSCRDMSRHSEGFQEKCEDLRNLLLDHLEREDRYVCSVLRADPDPMTSEMLERFNEELNEVIAVAREFFSTCSPDSSPGMEHIRDYGTFFVLLKDRMNREEEILFPQYERLCGNAC